MARQLDLWDDAENGGEAPPGVVASIPVAGAPPDGTPTGGEAPRAETADPAAVETLRKELCRLSGMHVFLKITNNTHSLMRVAHEQGGLHARLSLHWMFLDAPQAVITSLAGWVRHPRTLRKNSLLKAYMRANTDRIPAAEPRHVTIRTKGSQYDLAELYAEVNAAEFNGEVDAQITWGVMLPVGGGRSSHFRLGSYMEAGKLIRIHPVLDNPEVPRFVIRSIVFHEMLHAFLGIYKEEGKRRQIHHSGFKQREQQYKDHEAAEAWIKNPKNMRLLAEMRRHGVLWCGRLHREP